MNRTCEICDTEEMCLSGQCPCALAGEFIADVPRKVANVMLEELEMIKFSHQMEDMYGADIKF